MFGARNVGRLIDLPLTIFWVLLITNAFNLIDGLDGLAAGSALISAISILAVALVGHHELMIYLVVVLIGAICGFLPFNSFPASIFMGDSGSLFIGFLLSALGDGRRPQHRRHHRRRGSDLRVRPADSRRYARSHAAFAARPSAVPRRHRPHSPQAAAPGPFASPRGDGVVRA